MLTGRSLRLGLVGLVGLCVLCLVILQVSLRSKKIQAVYSRMFFDSEVLSQMRNLSVDISAQDSGNSAVSSGNVSSKDLSKASGLKGNSTGSLPGASGGNFSVVSGKSVNSSKTSAVNVSNVSSSSASSSSSPSSSSIDHCKEEGKRTSTEESSFSLQAQLLPDGSRPINCTSCFHSHFPLLLQNCSVCNTGGGKEKQGDVVEVLMVILTTHKAVDRRQAIRDTWASVSRNNTANVRHVFMLGRSKDEGAMKLAQEEHQRYGDIIMYDYTDSYGNLTLKTLTAMHWAVDYCNNTRFIAKVDDDMWLNFPSLLTTLKRENTTLHTAIGGACHMSAGPIRDSRSKWYASFKDYPQNSYPGFCSGTSYVTSLNVARHLVSVSPDVPFFYLEDVYMALCMKKLGPPFRLHGLGGFFFGHSNPCTLRSKGVITVHEVSPQKLREIWGAKCP